MGVAYAVGYRRLAARRAPTGRARSRAGLFAAGYLTLMVALLSPLHTLGEALFAVHMLQHLLVTLVAAPLLLLANSMPVLLWALPRQDRATLGRLVGRPGALRGALKLLSHPLVAWWLFVGAQWLWHQPAAYQWAIESRWAHYAEHLTFFGTALLFWWPVVGAPPLGSPLGYPARMLYTFLAWMPNSILGAGITFAPAPLYPAYVRNAQTLGLDPLVDQQLAGLIMWLPGDLLFVLILLLLLAAFVRDEQGKAERLDRLHGVGGG